MFPMVHGIHHSGSVPALTELISGTKTWWPFDEAGATAVDQVGAEDLTFSGSYAREQTSLNAFNSATQFSGGQAIISDVPAWVYQNPRDMSAAFWMKHSGDFTVPNQTILSGAVDSDSALETNHQFLIEVDSSSIRLFWEYGSGSNDEVNFSLPEGFDLTAPHHYALARDTTTKTVKFYIDRILVGSEGYTNNPDGDNSPSKEWIVGAYRLSGGGLDRQLSATLQDMIIFDKAVSSTEVAQLYADGDGVDYAAII